MPPVQAGILATETPLARYLVFSITNPAHLSESLIDLMEVIDPTQTVIGIGESLVKALGKTIPGLRPFPAQTGPGIELPAGQGALWCWLRGEDRGELFHRSRQLEELLLPTFSLTDLVDSFQYDANRDLTGYEDGTENPQDEAAIAAAVVQSDTAGLHGGSFVAVQQWLHDFDYFFELDEAERDNIIGRRQTDNAEFDEAPASAHVKRSAQESYSPEAFILRRSMPWAEGLDGGLLFVAFGKSFDAFEAILHRMLGNEDGVVDALFRFSRPVSGGYFWCPPTKQDRLDLSALGL
ncbi:MAG: Dyp-type peroxidase [Gammaproteobacteria bacterium]|nr:Dyp-type peroxidase [Gammaproteobacteria bacterium]MDH5650739.1 Dyp-type peroxidase [Gammaproteobacteria bacterium]